LAPIVVNYNIRIIQQNLLIQSSLFTDLPHFNDECTSPAFAVAMATDACGDTFTLTSADVTTDGDCSGSIL
jgi:hypothetical protein